MSAELTGLYVFPCRIDKTPAVAGGFKSATNDPAVIGLWRKRYFLMGAPTGPINSFDVLDVDTRHDGEAWLAEFEATHGFPSTRIHATRSGGVHFFFKHRPGLRLSAGLIAPGVDVRATDGYVVWWPLAGYKVLSEGPIAPWPAALIEAMHEAEERKAEARRVPLVLSPTKLNGALVPIAGDRQELPRALYFKMCELMPRSSGRDRRRVRELLNIVVQKRENRNDALNRIAFLFRELISADVITRDAAESLLIGAATLNGYVAKDGLAAAIATIRSGLGHQAQEPHPISLLPDENSGGSCAPQS
jgi:hypothetical protein